MATNPFIPTPTSPVGPGPVQPLGAGAPGSSPGVMPPHLTPGPNANTGGTASPTALQPQAGTSPAFNQTAPGNPVAPDLTPFMNVDVSGSTLAQDSELGEDLTQAPSFIPATPANAPQPTKWEVTADQTVEARFDSIMDSDNPVFKDIQERIMREHAARGGQNSLMAARSAAMAVAEVGFKIASQDAATFARSAEFNAAMANQFGLAEQQFQHNAMLSEQNFKQGIMMLRESQLADLEKINADMKSRLNLMGAQSLIDINMEATKHQNTLAQMDRAHRQNLESMETQFQYNWQSAEQSQRQALERMDRETTNAGFMEQQKFAWQMQLNYMSEVSQNGRMLLNTVGAIGSNPNITAAQAQAAVADAIRQYNAVNEQLASTYKVPSNPALTAQNYLDFSGHNTGYGTNTGQTAPSIPFYGGQPGTPTGGSPVPGAAPPPAPVAPIAAPAPAPAPVQPVAPVAAPAQPPGNMVVMNGRVPGVNQSLYNSDPAYKRAWDQAVAEHQSSFGRSYTKDSSRQAIEDRLVQLYQQYR